MKTLTVKKDNGAVVYGLRFRSDEEGNDIPYTEPEQENNIYEQIAENVRREEFDKNLVSLIKDHCPHIDDWKEIKIEVEYSEHGHLSMNLRNKNKTASTHQTEIT